MPIIGEQSIAASEVEGLHDPLVGREIETSQPLVQCVNCDTVYFMSSYDSLTQSNRSQCLNCKSDKFNRIEVVSGSKREGRWGKGGGSKKSVSKKPDFIDFEMPLPGGRVRLPPPTIGEKWINVVSKNLQDRISKLLSKEDSQGDRLRKRVVKWRDSGWSSNKTDIYFTTDFGVYKVENFSSLSKANVRKTLLFFPSLLSDFDVDYRGNLLVARDNEFLSRDGVELKPPSDLSVGRVHQDFSKLGCRPDLPRTAHIFEVGRQNYLQIRSEKRDAGFGEATSPVGEFDLQWTRLLWSPTGLSLLARQRFKSSPKVFLVGIDGAVGKDDVVRLDYNYSAEWHPQKDYLVADYTKTGENPRSGFHVYSFLDGKFGGRVLEVETGQSDWISDLSWSPDGRFIAAASEDGTVVLYDCRSGTWDTWYTGGNAASSVHFSPDGMRLAVSAGSNVYIYAIPNGEILAEFPGQISAGSSEVVKLSPWSPSGRELIVNDRYTISVVRLE